MKASCFLFMLLAALIESAFSQAYIGGAYDFGEGRHGERRGELSPAAIFGITIGAIAVLMALVVTVYLCYHVTENSNGMRQSYRYDQGRHYVPPLQQKPPRSSP